MKEHHSCFASMSGDLQSEKNPKSDDFAQNRLEKNREKGSHQKITGDFIMCGQFPHSGTVTFS